MNTKQEQLLARVLAEMEVQGLAALNARDLAEKMAMPVQAVTAIWELGESSGAIVRVGSLRYSPKILEWIAEQVRQWQDSFSPGDFRDRLATSRKYAVPLLEYLNESGVLERDGELHRVIS